MESTDEQFKDLTKLSFGEGFADKRMNCLLISRSAIITAARAAVEEEDYQWGLQLVDMILDSKEADL